MRRLLRDLADRCKTARPRRAPTRRPLKLRLEELEPRTTPTVICNANPVYTAECNYLGNLIPLSAITITAQQSGDWSNPATWGGRLPGNGDNVWIPNGITVTVDAQEPGMLRSILDNGVLQYATTVNTSLLVDTVVVGTDNNASGLPEGVFTMGTAANPIQANVTASLTFANDGSIASVFPNDYQQLSRGFISMNTASFYGAQVTPYMQMANAAAGSTTLQLASVPVNWNPGDTLLIPGTSPTQNQDEQLAIAAISGTTVTLAAPLAYDHASPAGQAVYVADEARNVIVQSQNSNPANYMLNGSVMFMHTDQEVIAYTDFLNLGRTNKAEPLNNAQLGANGSVIPGTGTNQVGRYAVHFHRDYWPTLSQNDPPILVLGNFQSGSPGWGYDNHSSNVDMEDNVAFGDFGAGFATEAGNELGTFNGNLSVRSLGLNSKQQAQLGISTEDARGDSGFAGDGFWIRAPLVTVTNNIAVGDGEAGFMFWTKFGLHENGLGVAENVNGVEELVAQVWTNPGTTQSLPTTVVPFAAVSGNTSYGDVSGAQIWWHAPPSTKDSLSDFTIWNIFDGFLAPSGHNTTGIAINYSSNTGISNSWIYGSLSQPIGTGIQNNNGYARDNTFINNRIEGWTVGINMPDLGVNVVSDGYYNDVQGIYFDPGSVPIAGTYQATVQGQPQFGTLSPGALAGATQYDYYLQPINWNSAHSQYATVPDHTQFTNLFHPSAVLLNTRTAQGELYWNEQAANYVPFPTSGIFPLVPAKLSGISNAQMWQSFGLAIDGAVAPSGATALPGSNGLLGTASSYAPLVFAAVSPTFTSQLASQVISYVVWSGTLGNQGIGKKYHTQPLQLQQGWNLVTEVVAGATRTLLVFGDAGQPTISVAPNQNLTVSQADLAKSFRLLLSTNDIINGPVAAYYAKLASYPIQTANGVSFIAITVQFTDSAGNTSNTLTVDVTVKF